MYGEWEQVSGDGQASKYGATFAQEDYTGDRLDGVTLVEIMNMPERCGSDYDSAAEDGDYMAECAYVEVDNLSLRKIDDILGYCGEWRGKKSTTELPEEIRDRIAWCKEHAAELLKLQEWTGLLSSADMLDYNAVTEEAESLREWFSIPAIYRAEMAHSYGGYTDGQTYTYWTLADAMDAHNVPASALWSPEEYDKRPDGIGVNCLEHNPSHHAGSELHTCFHGGCYTQMCEMCGYHVGEGWRDRWYCEVHNPVLASATME